MKGRVKEGLTLLVINPNTSASMTADIEESAKRAASRTTRVITVSPRRGPKVIEGPVDQALSIPGMLQIARKMDGRFDGIISACFADPGVEALKFASGLPVMGIRESAFQIAALLGEPFSVIVPVKGVETNLRTFARLRGMEEKLLSVEYAGVGVCELESGSTAVEEAVYRSAGSALKKGARALIFGCAGMGRMTARRGQAARPAGCRLPARRCLCPRPSPFPHHTGLRESHPRNRRTRADGPPS